MAKKDLGETYRKALESAENLVAAQKKSNAELESFKGTMDFVAKSLFNMSDSGFFKQIPKTVQEIQNANNQFAEMKELLSEMGEEINKGMGHSISGMFKDFDKAKVSAENLGEAFSGNINMLKKLQASFSDDKIVDLVKNSEDLSKFLEKNGQLGIDMVATFSDGNEELQAQLQAYRDMVPEVEKYGEELKKSNKTIFSMTEGVQNLATNLWTSAWEALKKYDDTISTAQKNTGIMFKENTQAMSALNTKAAALGVSTQETTELMGKLGANLNTTDFGVLSKAADNFLIIEGALGVSSDSIAVIGGEMMRFGSSSEEVKDAFSAANVAAKKVGVSTKSVIGQIDKNLVKMREFGFTGGIKSLTKMAVEAERLGVQVDSIFNVAQRARSIEGAMEMAAELQLAGGSFSSINPMDLLSAARQGPEELQKILTNMGKDIGHFNENGEYKFDPVDTDRLEIAAKAMGITVTEFQNMIAKTAEDNKKLKLIPDSAFKIEGADSEETKKFVSSLTKIGKKGKVEFSTDGQVQDMLREAGVNTEDVANLTADQVTQMLAIQKKRDENLEAQAAQNTSFTKSLENLQNSFMALFTVLEPAIIQLTKALSWIATTLGDSPPWLKSVLAYGLMIVSGAVLLNKAVTTFTGGGVNILKSIFTKKASTDMASKVSGGGPQQPKTPGGAEGSGGWIESMKKGLKGFGEVSMKDIGMFALALGVIGGALVLFSYAMAEIGGEASIKQMVTMGASLLMLGGSIVLLSKFSKGIDTKGLLTLSASMAIIGLAMIPFAYAAQMMNGIDIGNTIISLGSLALVVIALAVVGTALAASGGIAGIAVMAGAFLLLSVSLIPFAYAADMLSKVNWSSFSVMGPALGSAALGLAEFGLAILVGAPGFFVLPIAALGLMLFAQSASLITAIDWSAFSAMGSALMDALPGLLGFGASMFLMTGAFATMAIGAAGFMAFATGMGLLADAVARFDVGKFEKIAEASTKMAENSAASTIGGALNTLANAVTGGATGGNKTVTHVVNVQINGRDIQKLIIEDNSLLS